MQKFINVDPMEPGTIDEEGGGGGALADSEGVGLLYVGPEDMAESQTVSGADGADYSSSLPPPLYSFELGRQSDAPAAASSTGGSSVFSPLAMQMQQPTSQTPLPRPKDRPTKEPKSMKQFK